VHTDERRAVGGLSEAGGRLDGTEDIVADNRVDIGERTLDERDWSDARAAGTDVVVLPARRDDDGRGVYGESTVFLVKELRAAGVSASYADPSDRRVFEVKKSALGTALVSVALGLVSNAGWDGVKAWLRREQPDGQRLEVSFADLSADGARTMWTVKGPAEETLAAVDRLRGQPPE
jgi:hypothetical protein